ncbi:RNA binding protein [Arthrobacter phage Lunar]|uniref:RNA binding protein n=4 Tax=Coralvirus coral TaxID=2734227 RepID=A0A5J6TQF7_9CAUD|nr:RNA binding protein [Arthrobacter phage Cote]AYN58413.1 RNA binding protein [Arthrobacter phage Lunar]AYN58555.1 RNA binding protein [Arthrobacter phage Melons]QFG13060.1 RNA binding protein [Arthrobacter phage Amelia]
MLEIVAVVLLVVMVGLMVLLVRELGKSRELRRQAEASAAAAAAAPAPIPADPWRVVVARRCVVNLKSGRAVDGVLVGQDGPLLFLKNAVLLEQGNEPAAIDGEAVVQASEVDFIQAL